MQGSTSARNYEGRAKAELPVADNSASLIQDRIAIVLAMRQMRRRRVQIPLFVLCAILLLGGVALYVTGGRFVAKTRISYRWAYALVFTASMVIVLAAMPGDVILLRVICCGYGLLSSIVTFIQVPATLRNLSLVVAVFNSPTSASERAQHVSVTILAVGTTFVVVPATAVAMFGLLIASFRDLSALRFASLVLRTLSYSNLGAGILYGTLLTGVRPFDFPSHIFFPDDRSKRIEMIASFAVLFVLCTTMGLVGLLKRDLRANIHGWLAARGVGVNAAAGVSAMLNGVNANDVLAQASRSFRAVSLDDLSYNHLVRLHRDRQPSGSRRIWQERGIQEDARQKGSSAPSPEFRAVRGVSAQVLTARAPSTDGAELNLARPLELGRVDAFISHSWHDPPKAKWVALQAWGAEFKAQHGRAPMIWLDRLCINQSDVEAELPSLPVYLAGCRTLLVLHGPTYLRRLWCVVELFTFFHMHLPAPPADRIHFIMLDTPWLDRTARSSPRPPLVNLKAGTVAPDMSPLPQPAKSPENGGELGLSYGPQARSMALAEAESFDVRNASASLPADEEKLLAVIEGSGEAVKHFNQWIRTLVVGKLKEARELREGCLTGGSSTAVSSHRKLHHGQF